MQDIEEDLISPDTARDIYKVVFDERSRIVDVDATQQLRDDERRARMARGVPFDEFVKTWTTPEPPASLPFMGAWSDPSTVYGIQAGTRVTMPGSALQSQFMLNPKDVLIATLQAENEALKARLGASAG